MCYICIDQLKRGHSVEALKEAGEGPIVMAHASVPWSLKHGAGGRREEEADGLRQSVQVIMSPVHSLKVCYV